MKGTYFYFFKTLFFPYFWSNSLFFIYLYFLAAPRSTWDLSSPTRDQTHAPAWEVQSLNHWTAREVPTFKKIFNQNPLFWLSQCLMRAPSLPHPMQLSARRRRRLAAEQEQRQLNTSVSNPPPPPELLLLCLVLPSKPGSSKGPFLFSFLKNESTL